MTEYFGFMVCELDGDIDDLHIITEEEKPKHEACGFSYAKWFTDIKERDKCREYTRNVIKKIQEDRNEQRTNN